MNHYTIPFFVGTIKGTTVGDWNGVTTGSRISYANLISPRVGLTSIKIKTLNSLLGGNLSAIVHGVGDFSVLGITPRARLLKSLSLVSKGTSFLF